MQRETSGRGRPLPPQRSDNGGQRTHVAPRPLRRPAGRNMSEAGASVVNRCPSDGGIGSAEPLNRGRRQDQERRSGDEPLGLPGVRGLARGEGCWEKDGRPSEVSTGVDPGRVRGGISETREVLSEASRGVGGDRSTGENSVMEEEGRVSALAEFFGRVGGEPTGREAYKRQRIASGPGRRDTEGAKSRERAESAGFRVNDAPAGTPTLARAFRHRIAGCGRTARPVRRGGGGNGPTVRATALLYSKEVCE